MPRFAVTNSKSFRRGCLFVFLKILTQPTISDGRLAPVIAQQWKGGLVVWGTPEKQTGSMVSFTPPDEDKKRPAVFRSSFPKNLHFGKVFFL